MGLPWKYCYDVQISIKQPCQVKMPTFVAHERHVSVSHIMSRAFSILSVHESEMFRSMQFSQQWC
jgi:hypothetical protein